jgi:hypothetical protein
MGAYMVKFDYNHGFFILAWVHPYKDGNGAVSGRISAGFESRGFGDDSSPMVFGFGAPKPIEFGFSPMDIQNKSYGVKTHVFIIC